MHITLQSILLLVCMLSATSWQPVLAQAKAAPAANSPLCTRVNALEMIEQQIDLTRTYDDTTRRITVLIRAADLLWPYQQDSSRAVFKNAFELAVEHEKEGDQTRRPRSVLLRLQVPDQRYVVIRAVAKRDATWAKELTAQLLKLDNTDETSSNRSSLENVVTGERLLDSARKLMPTDLSAAFDFARASLNYPAGSTLTRFLYELAAVNQQAADQFYVQALAVYGHKPMREFLYLQAYPFAWPDTVNTPIFSYYTVPPNFVTNRSLQRQFMQIMLLRARQGLEGPADESDTYRDPTGTLTPATVSLLQGLVRLEPQVRESLPDLLGPLTQAREKILVSLPVETQKLLLQPGREISTKPDQSFAERIESAQKEPDLNERDQLITAAIFGSDKQSLPSVLEAIEQIGDSSLRGHLLEWLYFQRATTAVKNKQFADAERLTAKVEGHEQRGFLYTEIAKALLSRSDTQTHAQEVLDEAITEAKKAGTTIFAARTLLTASNLYVKIDVNRSIAVLADAINCINRLDAADFVSDGQALEKRPKRKGKGGQYRGEYVFRFYMPGFDPESAFREMAKIDFDTSLSQSSTLTDKFQRALSTLAVAEVCLQQTPVRNPKKVHK